MGELERMAFSLSTFQKYPDEIDRETLDAAMIGAMEWEQRKGSVLFATIAEQFSAGSGSSQTGAGQSASSGANTLSEEEVRNAFFSM